MTKKETRDFGGKAITLPFDDAKIMFAAFLDAADDCKATGEEFMRLNDYEIIKSHAEAFGYPADFAEHYNPDND